MHSLSPVAAVPLLLVLGVAHADDAKQYEEQVRPILKRHCLGCHGAEKPKGDLRLDRLSPNFADGATREHWLEVLKRVHASDMPPKEKPRPTEAEVRTLTGWIR